MCKKAISLLLILVVFFIITLPNLAHAEAGIGDVNASSYILIEASGGNVITEKNADEKKSVAGLVKLMSFLVLFEELSAGRINSADMVDVSENAAKVGGTSVFLDAGSQYKFEDLLEAAIISSANDATIALGEHVFGTEQAFFERMNARANELGLNCTFADCTGISAEAKVSAKDISVIASALSKNPAFFKYSTIWMKTFIHNSGRETEMASANKLIKVDGFDGMGTGSSPSAGYCLAASYKSGNARFICVVLDAQNSSARFSFAEDALKYAAANYSVTKVVEKNAFIKSVPIKQAKNNTADIYASDELVLMLKKGEEQGLLKSVNIYEDLTAPLNAGDKVGEFTVTLVSGESISVDLIVNEDIPVVTLSSSLGRVLEIWLSRGIF